MANRAPTPTAAALPPPPADDAAAAYGENHGNLVEELYLPDGTFVQRYEDGTEFHYPPENAATDANANAYGYGTYDNGVPPPVGSNPMTQFYGYDAHYQQPAGAMASTPMANANSLGPAPPLATAPPTAGMDNTQANESKRDKKRRDKEAEDANVAAVAADQVISADEEVKADELPTSGFWLVDCLSEAFFSLAFKLWACQLFMNVFMIFFFYGLDFLFATQYRLIAPPTDMTGGQFWQTMAFGCIFLALSFFIVTLLRMLIDVIREIFTARRADNVIFGFRVSATHPPYVVHCVLVVLLTVVPVMWAIILTASSGRTFAYLVQFFLFCSTMLAIFAAFLIFLLMWVSAFWMKTLAYNQRDEEKRMARDYAHKHPNHARRRTSDDDVSESETESQSESESDDDNANADGADGQRRRSKKKKRRHHRRRRARHTTTISATGRTMAAAWYDSDLTLQEFGLNTKTVRWMIPVFVFGWIPVQVVTAIFIFDSVAPSWDIIWIIVGFIIIISFIGLAEGNTRFTPRVGTFVNLVIIILFMCFGILCTAIAGNSTLVGIFIVLLILTHGLLLRKRPYEMQPHEIEAVFGPAADQVATDGEPVDTYLCLCRNTLLEFMRCGDCCDVYGVFGRKNAKVRAVEKQYRKENLALMTDMRFLMYYWIILWIAMAGATSFATQLSPWYTGRTFAVGPGNSPRPTYPQLDSFGSKSRICDLNFNAAFYNSSLLANAAAKFNNATSGSSFVPWNMTALDLAMMGSLANSIGGTFTTSANIWFTVATPQVQIINPPSGGQTDNIGRYGYQWFDVYDSLSKLRVIYVSSMSRGSGWMRAIDLYGGVFAFDMASAFAPFISVWPEDVKVDFITGVNFLKSWYKGDVGNDYAALEAHVRNQTNYNDNVLLAGHGVGGAIARIIAMRNNLPSFTFNAPGTRLTRSRMGAGYATRPDLHHTLVHDCDSWQQIDKVGGDTTVHYLYAARGNYHSQFDPACSAPHQMIHSLINLCGDPVGRDILDIFN